MPERVRSEEVAEESEVTRVQRRTVWVLAIGQILGGLGFGATVSLGAVIVARMTGDDALSGLATACVTLGTALLAMPLATLARRSGRRISLTTGMVIALVGVALVIFSTAAQSFPLLLISFALIGAGQAVNLQSRFAAVDLASDRNRGRDLSVVVWATTIGAVLGPNLIEPGEVLGQLVGMPALTGPYLFTVVAQSLAVVLFQVALRPDPLRLAQRIAVARNGSASAQTLSRPDHPVPARYAIVSVAVAHGSMISVMAMTPVHLLNHGAQLSVIGLTISLHIAGMFALSPVFGILADRIGRVPTIVSGQVILVVSTLIAWLGADSIVAVSVSLTLLGLGWSASSVAGAALLTEASTVQMRTRRQGISDFTMSVVGGIGAILAGVVLGLIGYGGLGLVVGVAVIATMFLAPLGRIRVTAD